MGQMDSPSNLSVTNQLAVHLSGIAVELAVGIVLAVMAIFLSKRRSFRALLAFAAGVLIVHSLFYLTLGTYYGSGDGHLLYTLLQGGIRQNFLILTTVLIFSATFLISYQFSPMVKSWVLTEYSTKRMFVIILCASIAVLFHAMLTFGERFVVNDTVYAKMKTSENERLKEAELAKFIADYLEEHDEQPDQEQLRNQAKALEKKYWQFPLEIFLGMGIVAATLFGYIKSKRKEHEDSNPITWKDIFHLGSPSILVATLILILNRI